MSRIPPAARLLISEVRDYNDDATAEPDGEPDGLGLHRAIAFDHRTSGWLTPVMELIAEDDERIAEVHTNNDCLIVTFVGDVRADFTQPYGIATVADVFAEGDDEEPEQAPSVTDETADDDGEDR